MQGLELGRTMRFKGIIKLGATINPRLRLRVRLRNRDGFKLSEKMLILRRRVKGYKKNRSVNIFGKRDLAITADEKVRKNQPQAGGENMESKNYDCFELFKGALRGKTSSRALRINIRVLGEYGRHGRGGRGAGKLGATR